MGWFSLSRFMVLSLDSVRLALGSVACFEHWHRKIIFALAASRN
jgi:hypothetical protein